MSTPTRERSIGGITLQLNNLSLALSEVQEFNDNGIRKTELADKKVARLADDSSSLTADMADVKFKLSNMSMGSAEELEMQRKVEKEAKKASMVEAMLADLQDLHANVEAVLEKKENDEEDDVILSDLQGDMMRTISEVKAELENEEELGDNIMERVSSLSIKLATVLQNDTTKNERNEAIGLFEEGMQQTRLNSLEDNDTDNDDEDDPESGMLSVAGHSMNSSKSGSSSPSRTGDALGRKTTLRQLTVVHDASTKIEENPFEKNLRDRMAGTGKRLADLMGQFSNVGRLELAVRQLKENEKTAVEQRDAMVVEAKVMKEQASLKANMVEVDGHLAEKADLKYVQSLLDELKNRTDALDELTKPENMMEALKFSTNAVDELSANLSQTLENFTLLKKEVGNKAASSEVTSALSGIQASMRQFVGQSFTKEELENVLKDKVNKRDLKKLSAAIAGMDGPASLAAGATKCIVCDRPGQINLMDVVNAQMGGPYDPLDSNISVGSLGGGDKSDYNLAPVRFKPGSTGGSSRSGGGGGRNNMYGSNGPESPEGYDDINRYENSENNVLLMDGNYISKNPRIMPPANRMRTSAGGMSGGGKKPSSVSRTKR
jgi:hypothetical protein